VWGDSHVEEPPPVNVARHRPKSFYAKPNSDTMVLSKFYLQTLLPTGSITCSEEVEHFESDHYYKWLLSNGTFIRRKRSHVASLGDDASALVALMDSGRGRKRGRREIGMGGGGRGALKGRTHKKDERTMHWGP
jgi:hypothetical protein